MMGEGEPLANCFIPELAIIVGPVVLHFHLCPLFGLVPHQELRIFRPVRWVDLSMKLHDLEEFDRRFDAPLVAWPSQVSLWLLAQALVGGPALHPTVGAWPD
jgi:hypothetical protein